MIYDRRKVVRVKGKVYKVAVRPTVIYGLDTKKEKGGAGGAKIFIDVDQDGAVLEMSVSDGHFGETADMVLHVQRRDTGYTGQRMLKLEKEEDLWM